MNDRDADHDDRHPPADDGSVEAAPPSSAADPRELGWWPDGGEARPVGAGPGAEVPSGAGTASPRPRTTASRWAAAVLAGIAVAVLAVLGINVIASAATSADAHTTVFGPFGVGQQNRNPPFSATGGRGGRAAPNGPGQPTGGAAITSEDLTIVTVAGDRLETRSTTGAVVVQLESTTAIRDGVAVLTAAALRPGQRVHVTGTLTGGVLRAIDVEVIH